MKVVKKEAPKEEVKFTNVFGEEYTPEEEFEFICDDCLAEEVVSLKEDVAGLAEDILDHEEVLQMLGEKIQAVEDDQLQDVENLSNVVDILGCLQEAHKLMLEIIIDQDRWIRKLDKLSVIWAVVVFVWLAVLTVLFGIYVF